MLVLFLIKYKYTITCLISSNVLRTRTTDLKMHQSIPLCEQNRGGLEDDCWTLIRKLRNFKPIKKVRTVAMFSTSCGKRGYSHNLPYIQPVDVLGDIDTIGDIECL